jgi:hypothetical protein
VLVEWFLQSDWSRFFFVAIGKKLEDSTGWFYSARFFTQHLSPPSAPSISR